MRLARVVKLLLIIQLQLETQLHPLNTLALLEMETQQVVLILLLVGVTILHPALVALQLVVEILQLHINLLAGYGAIITAHKMHWLLVMVQVILQEAMLCI